MQNEPKERVSTAAPLMSLFVNHSVRLHAARNSNFWSYQIMTCVGPDHLSEYTCRSENRITGRSMADSITLGGAVALSTKSHIRLTSIHQQQQIIFLKRSAFLVFWPSINFNIFSSCTWVSMNRVSSSVQKCVAYPISSCQIWSEVGPK